jgi:hypothetical protein
MTLKNVQNLGKRQMEKSSSKIFQIALLGQQKLSPKLLREVFLRSEVVGFNQLKTFFCRRITEHNDVKLLNFLNAQASEINNPNSLNRQMALNILAKVAESGDKRTLEGLFTGLADSNSDNRYFALQGLNNLAQRGVKETLQGLLIGLNETALSPVSFSLTGLAGLAKNGVHEALPGLLIGLKKDHDGHKTIAKAGIVHLAKLGNKKAQKVLEEINILSKS